MSPPLPVHGIPAARLMGWHLWISAKSESTDMIAELTDSGRRTIVTEGSVSAQSSFDLGGPRMLRKLQAKGQVGARCGREGHQ
jgi:hypothetical protein